MSIKIKTKPQWDSTVYAPGWLKLKINVVVPNVNWD
jgi:hypothetical protein